MTRSTSKMRRLAKQLLVHEMPGDKSSDAKAPATFPVTEKLRPPLANLMGNGGFQALLARALVLATAEVPWLRALHVKADGTLEALEAFHARPGPADLLEGRIVLLAQLLGLLVAFIGPGMTSRLVGEIWPQISLDDTDFGKERQNEKAK
jgi:hypothetical protein